MKPLISGFGCAIIVILCGAFTRAQGDWQDADGGGEWRTCSRRRAKYGYVCVCDQTHCDQVPQVWPDEGDVDSAVQIESASDGTFMRVAHLRWQHNNHSGDDDTPGNIAGEVKLRLSPGITYQELVGFGGAFTDTTGANLATLPADLADTLLRQYFDHDGARYTLGRVPMASVDMSVRVYSYDDVEDDFDLQHFNLTREDYEWKIPHIHRAAALVTSWAANTTWFQSRGYPLLLYCSAWSAPWWMKSTKNMRGPGVLIGDHTGPYWKAYALYFARFMDSYTQSHGIPMWGLTVVNEPTGAFVPGFPWQAMGMTAYMTRDFVKYNLGPEMQRQGYADAKLMVLDDQRFMLGSWADRIYTDPEASKYVSGMAVHWYWDSFVPPSALSSTHAKYPDKFLLASEACNGEAVGTAMPPGVQLGDWDRAEAFAHDIIQDLTHWVIGWVEWNLCLNETGGPTWTENVLDSPIIVNAADKQFYKQPTFYALAHFSAYISPESKVMRALRLSATTVDMKKVQVLATIRPDHRRVLVLLNKSVLPVSVYVQADDVPGKTLTVNMRPRSISTVLFNRA